MKKWLSIMTVVFLMSNALAAAAPFGSGGFGCGLFGEGCENLSEADETPTAPGGSGGGSSFSQFVFGQKKIGVFDVIVRVEDNFYNPGDEVTAHIIIKNNGDDPDEDATLTYFLTSSDTTLHEADLIGRTREELLEVPPIAYRKPECEAAGGFIEEKTGQCATDLTRSLVVPLDGIRGEWRFNVEYDSEHQDLIQVYDVFSVMGRTDFLIIIVLIALFFYNDYQKKRKK